MSSLVYKKEIIRNIDKCYFYILMSNKIKKKKQYTFLQKKNNQLSKAITIFIIR